VDGATVISDQYEVLTFGAKIVRRDGGAQVEQVVVTEPVLGSEASVVPPVQLGGTRHLSAAQFVQDQRNAVALRTDASQSSPGLHAKRWCTLTASRRCCSETFGLFHECHAWAVCARHESSL
jgi:hypothetical protein